MLHNDIFGNRKTADQEVVNRENRPQSMGSWISMQRAVYAQTSDLIQAREHKTV